MVVLEKLPDRLVVVDGVATVIIWPGGPASGSIALAVELRLLAVFLGTASSAGNMAMVDSLAAPRVPESLFRNLAADGCAISSSVALAQDDPV